MLHLANFKVATALGSARKLSAACTSGPSMLPDRSRVEREVAMGLFSFKLLASIVAPAQWDRQTDTR